MKKCLLACVILATCAVFGLLLLVPRTVAVAQQAGEVVVVKWLRGVIMPSGMRPVPGSRGLALPGTKLYDEYAVRLSAEFVNASGGASPSHPHLQAVVRVEGEKKILQFEVRDGSIPALNWCAEAWEPAPRGRDRILARPCYVSGGTRTLPANLRMMIVRFDPATGLAYPVQVGQAEPGVTYAMRKQMSVENGIPTTRYFLVP